MVIAGSMPEADAGRIYNTLHLVDADGRIAGAYRKVHLFSVTDEHRYFSSGRPERGLRHLPGSGGADDLLRFTVSGALPRPRPQGGENRGDARPVARCPHRPVGHPGPGPGHRKPDLCHRGQSVRPGEPRSVSPAIPSSSIPPEPSWRGRPTAMRRPVSPSWTRRIRRGSGRYMPSLKERMPGAYEL